MLILQKRNKSTLEMKISHLKTIAICSSGSCESKLVRELNIKHILKVTIFVSHITVVEHESKWRQNKMEDWRMDPSVDVSPETSV